MEKDMGKNTESMQTEQKECCCCSHKTKGAHREKNTRIS